MRLPTIEVTVTTTEDREEMFAELFADGIQWGEVTLGRLDATVVKIFPSRNWSITLPVEIRGLSIAQRCERAGRDVRARPIASSASSVAKQAFRTPPGATRFRFIPNGNRIPVRSSDECFWARAAQDLLLIRVQAASKALLSWRTL